MDYVSATDNLFIATTKRKFSTASCLKLLKLILPLTIAASFFPETTLAAGAGKDLMASGDETVKGTFGKDSSVVKWVILAEVLVGGVMYMTTKNLKFLAGFAILSVFITVGMAVAGY